jgi:hypothetical protein
VEKIQDHSTTQENDMAPQKHHKIASSPLCWGVGTRLVSAASIVAVLWLCVWWAL